MSKDRQENKLKSTARKANMQKIEMIMKKLEVQE